MILAHISDIHFGRIGVPGIVEAMLADVNNHSVDLVIISGDLTQRARASQFKAAADMIQAFEPPVMVVPGNHDVPAWYRPFARMFNPLSRYERFISPEMAPTFEAPGLAVMGVNSAHAWTVKGGHIRSEHLAMMRTFFCQQEPGTFRVLVVHHHLLRIKELGPHDVAWRSEGALKAALECNVQLVLCGHLHQSHVHHLTGRAENDLVIASAGTATSSRGRRTNRRKNYFNLIRVDDQQFSIEEHCYEEATRRYHVERMHTFDRKVSFSDVDDPASHQATHEVNEPR